MHQLSMPAAPTFELGWEEASIEPPQRLAVLRAGQGTSDNVLFVTWQRAMDTGATASGMQIAKIHLSVAANPLLLRRMP